MFRDQIPTKPILEDKVTENFIISLCEVSLGRKCVITFTYLFIYIYSLSQQWLVSFANQCRYMFLELFFFFYSVQIFTQCGFDTIAYYLTMIDRASE